MTWKHVRDDVETRPDATQRSRIFWVYFMNAERSDNEDCTDARPSHPYLVLLWEESCCSGKAVAEDRPEDANFNLDAKLP
jgi:hypothetical protein